MFFLIQKETLIHLKSSTYWRENCSPDLLWLLSLVKNLCLSELCLMPQAASCSAVGERLVER